MSQLYRGKKNNKINLISTQNKLQQIWDHEYLLYVTDNEFRVLEIRERNKCLILGFKKKKKKNMIALGQISWNIYISEVLPYNLFKLYE